MDPMDSELTLVGLAPPTAYYLSSTDLTDAIIYAQPAVPLYRITTNTRYIKIYASADGIVPDQLIAVLHRRDLFSDTISFPQQQGVGAGMGRDRTRVARTGLGSGTQASVQRWLKRSKMVGGKPMYTILTEYGPYVWKVDSKHRHKVFADYDLEKPVASCYVHPALRTSAPAFVLQSSGEPLRDDIVVAYVVQRHRISMENKALELFVGPS